MKRILVVVTLLLTMSAATTPRGNLTLDDIIFQETRLSATRWARNEYNHILNQLPYRDDLNYRVFDRHQLPFDGKDVELFLDCLFFLSVQTVKNFSLELGSITVESILEDLNGHCSPSPGAGIEDLLVKLSDTTCVISRLSQMLEPRFHRGVDFGLQQMSRRYNNSRLAERRHCTLEFNNQVLQLLRGYIEDYRFVIPPPPYDTSPLVIILIQMENTLDVVWDFFVSAYNTMIPLQTIITYIQSVEPLTLENILLYLNNPIVKKSYLRNQSSKTKDESTWGVVRSITGSSNFTCSNYRDVYSSSQFRSYYAVCLYIKIAKSVSDFLSCVFRDPTSTPLAWSTLPSFFVHSHCLCVASNGEDCGVKPPLGVDSRTYCLSVLLTDFQRQVWYRPAVTYMDYAFMTPVPVCKFSYFLSSSFNKMCKDFNFRHLASIFSARCYYKDIFNKDVNCTEHPILHTYNLTELCAAMKFNDFVLCDEDEDEDFHLHYYGTGDSNLVLLLTYLDVAVRVLTVITYLACPQLRNLPGKLLIAYMLTALMRLLVVRVSLEYLSMAVRLDVALDLSSTLWLTAYLHFLTVCIMDLRPPDSLTRAEARRVLLRCSLLGWALPAALSTAFFLMDQYIDSHVKVGQLLFLLLNYTALFANMFMFYKNCKFYYEVRKNAIALQKHVKASRVFADLFNFALKTSVLSGAGIIFRLVFTQIQGLENVLSYYHVLSTLHGFLLFLLYGCNREACAFWISILHSTLLRCRLCQTALPSPPNSFELGQIPSRNVGGLRTEDVPRTTG